MNTTGHTITPPLLEIKSLCLSFNQQEQLAVDRLNLKMAEGSTLGLVGASGAGKSSVARAILQLIKPDSGEILYRGVNIERMTPHVLKTTRQRVQLVFQDPSVSLSPRRTVEQTLLEPLQHFAIGDANYRSEKALQVLQTVGLDQSAMKRYPHQFSSGQQQRIAIARALVTDPELLIADEAVASLDVSVQAQILQLIQKLQNDFGLAFLFISHDLGVIRQIADDIAVMYQGQILEKSSADQFFSEPAHPYSKALLSFARDEIPKGWQNNKWYLERNHRSTNSSSSCVFTEFCPDKKQVCGKLEPKAHIIKHKNQHVFESHCVKCHLYDESKNYEI